MSNFKVKYASQVNLERDWTFSPGQYFQFDWDKLQSEFPEPQCWLVALDDREINILLHMLSVFPKYYKNWGFEHKRTWDEDDETAWDEIQTFISETELCLMSGCEVSALLDEIRRLNAIIAGEEVTIDEVPYDYTETGLVPSLNAALFVDRLLYPDLSISEVLFKGLIARTVDLPLPLEGVGIGDIADLILTMLTQLDGRFRQTDLTLPPPFEKNITETLETLLRTTGLFDPELKPNVTDTLLHTLSVGNDSFLWKAFINLANQILAQLGSDIRIPVDDEDPKTLAEILLVISRLLENGNIMTGQLDLSTIINLNNFQACGCANGNCTCTDGPTITVDDDTAQITEGGDNLLECGCSEE